MALLSARRWQACFAAPTLRNAAQFMSDALEVMRTLKETQDQMPADDPNVAYMLSSWARICQILGRCSASAPPALMQLLAGMDFLPYLDVVMPSLIASAKLKPDVVSA